MLSTLKYSFSLRNTCRVNSIIDFLRHFPLLGRLFTDRLYQNRGIKLVAWCLSLLAELIGIFLTKGLYFLLLIFLPTMLLAAELDSTMLYLNLLLLMSFTGGLVNRRLVTPSMERYYGIFMLRMDARSYTLANYLWYNLKLLVGFLAFSLLFGGIFQVPLWLSLMIPFSVAGIKVYIDARCLKRYRRKGGVYTETAMEKGWLAILLLAAVLAALTCLQGQGYPIPSTISGLGYALMLFMGCTGLGEIVRFDRYREINLTQIQGMFTAGERLKQSSDRLNRDAISEDTPPDSEKTGFAYLNSLFVSRHKKILWKPCKLQSIVLLGLTLLVCGLILLLFPGGEPGSCEELILERLPDGLYVMYLLNRGEKFTKALFHNCDRSLLTYSSFRQPENILSLFRLRLLTLMGMNLVPASILAVGLCLVLALLGGPASLLSYAVILVSILFMSIFYSVHNLTIYYLLQPYNIDSQVKSGIWILVNACTWLVSLHLSSFVEGSLWFGLGCIAFTVVYFAVACVLVYHLAPKTFRLRY